LSLFNKAGEENIHHRGPENTERRSTWNVIREFTAKKPSREEMQEEMNMDKQDGSVTSYL
jgi:hypothetical protein